VISGVESDENNTDDFDLISCREKMRGSTLSIPFTQGITSKERKELYVLGKQKIREAAIDNGIVDKTKENAKTFLRSFIAPFGYEAIVTFDEKAYDPTQPEK
jgi:hypothetical protein